MIGEIWITFGELMIIMYMLMSLYAGEVKSIDEQNREKSILEDTSGLHKLLDSFFTKIK